MGMRGNGKVFVWCVFVGKLGVELICDIYLYENVLLGDVLVVCLWSYLLW